MKGILITISAGIIFVAILFVSDAVQKPSNNTINKATNTNLNLNKTPTTNINNPLAKDSDFDGIADFEESNYNTDPFNPDSDGDGFLDGEEIKAGTDPLKDESVTPKPIITPAPIVAPDYSF
ncbi:MAG: hypothetical protein COV29_00315 [Candidatus Yanofskybacteria bacterium CG10_big_fil_rev_8_21_14_0_10_36_16]|uniref:EF-hand domain-containing protein n=1 Tax=Candidatus Yanofskybacteria bacterium CG10_big_fil_rev_8_21_14_0_10_36_16 TaxID=1975096 RepID=A0A2J0Q8K6_9BACT|nr:MAG: hypothetical protein COV29_00315 [Candidatus Yanofskybacteria bacterium CG10_big_fil_rev_8_21_14_0_10_36_16]